MKKQLVIVGAAFLFITVFLIATSFVIDNAKADGASGTWEGTCTVETGAANFYYNAVLTLTGGSSVSGTLQLDCTSVNVKISGFEDSQNMVGTRTTDEVDGTMSGSTLTLYVYDSTGTYTFYMTVSGGTMTGGGQYTGVAGETVIWSFNLRSGGGGGFGDFFSLSDLSVFATPSSAIALTGGVLGVAASFLPAPRGIMGFRGQNTYSSSVPRGSMGFRGRTRKQPHYHHPIVTQKYRTSLPPPPPPVATPPPPPVVTPAALRDPNETLVMPLQPLGSTNGDHLVPWDAPRQCEHDQDPRDYPYQKGTSAAMRCSYCGCNTLSPFTTGWYCTNPLCPARREWLQKRCTHHEFNNMTWRQP